MEVGLATTPFPKRGRLVNGNSKANDMKTTDLTQFKKAYGDKKLDEVLNGMSDPRYMDKKRKVNGVGNPELGKDAFFKLMMTQLKQQDPTNPLKSHEMAAQLAQFSSVEQLSNIKESIDKMGQKEDHSQFEVLNLMGKVVSGDSSKIKRTLGDKQHKVDFELVGSADSVNVSIKDASGNTVKRYELKNLQKGKNQVVWNGLNNEDSEVPTGDYRAEIEASNGGQRTFVKTKFKGAVDGVTFSKAGPLLNVDGKTLALKDVVRIEAPKVADSEYRRGPMGAIPPGQMAAAMRTLAVPPGMAGPQGAVPRSAQAPGSGKKASPLAPSQGNASGNRGITPGGPLAQQAQAMRALAQKAQRQQQAPTPQRRYQAGDNAFKRPQVQPQVGVTDINKKYSKGAYQPPKILANLENMNMDGQLKHKLMRAKK